MLENLSKPDVSQQTFQRCFNVVFRLIWPRDVAQRQTNVEGTLCTSNVGIYNIEQRRINVVYFNVDMNNVRERGNNVGQHRNNVVNMNTCKKDKNKTSSQK